MVEAARITRRDGSGHEHNLSPARHSGWLGVRTAVAHVNGEIARAMFGHDVREQSALDRLLIELDGTPHLKRLGANAILAVSLAACRAAAASQRIPLHRWVAELAGTTPCLPMPMVNLLSGGLHAGRGMDVQDFLAVPASATSMTEAIELACRVRSAAADALVARACPPCWPTKAGWARAWRRAGPRWS